MNTPEGARKAADTVIRNHGLTEDGRSKSHVEAGAKGGRTKTKTPKGFASMDKEKVAAAGRRGGSMGKRRPKGSKLSPETQELIRLQRIHWEANR